MGDQQDRNINAPGHTGNKLSKKETLAGASDNGLDGKNRRKKLLDLLYRLIAFVKASSLYPPGHERCLKIFDDFTELGQTLFNENKNIEIYVNKRRLIICDEESPETDSIVVSFVPELIKRNIRSLSIDMQANPSEINHLARLLNSKPDKIRSAGGAQQWLASQGVEHIEIHEFSVESHRCSAENSERNPAKEKTGFSGQKEFDKNGASEKVEPLPSTDQQTWLNCLSSHDGLLNELKWFEKIHEGDQAETDPLQRDLLKSLASAYLKSRPDKQDIDEEAINDITSALKTLRIRLEENLGKGEDCDVENILDRISSKMMSEPDAILSWLKDDNGSLDFGVSARLGELLKAVFIRSVSNERTVQFGDTDLDMMKSSKAEREEEEGAGAKKQPSRNEQENTVSDVIESYKKLKTRMGYSRLLLNTEESLLAHFNILIDLLRREENAKARLHFLERIKDFLVEHLAKEDEVSLPHSLGKIEHQIFKLSHREQALIMKDPGLFRFAMEAFLEGEKRWYGTLSRMGRDNGDFFACQFAEWYLSIQYVEEPDMLDGLMSQCERALASWLNIETKKASARTRTNGLVELALHCKTQLVVPAICRLLERVETSDYKRLITWLTVIKEDEAMELLDQELTNPEIEKRETVMRALGNCKHPKAEFLLLNIISKPSLFTKIPEEQYTALCSLGKCGTSESLPVLRKIMSNRLLLITKNHRLLRAHAEKAFRWIKNRE